MENHIENSQNTTLNETGIAVNKTCEECQMTERILPEQELQVGEVTYLIDNIDKSMLQTMPLGLNRGNDGYYYITPQTKQKPKTIQRLTNFTLKLANKVILKEFNNPEKEKYMYEIEIDVNGQKQTVLLTPNDLKYQQRFDEIMTGYAHYNSVMDAKQHRILTAMILSSDNAETIIEYTTAGYNVCCNNNIFLTKNKCYFYGGENTAQTDIRLSNKSMLQPQFFSYEEVCSAIELQNRSGETSPKKVVAYLLKELFNMLDSAYNKHIEPYIVISMAFVTLFLKQISEDFFGTPIISLYGEAASGKTNLLRLICYAFGLDPKRDLHGGMDTVAGLIEDLENYVNIPLLVDEVELGGIDSMKRLIKAVYEQTGRKKYNCKNRINTTLFFNSNYKFLYDLEYRNRCIELNFEQVNFLRGEAEKFNHLQKYLSFVSQYIIENVTYDEIKLQIKEEEQSDLLSEVEDNRARRNLAVAISSLKLLIKLVDEPSVINFASYEECLKKYISNVVEIKNDDTDRFIIILKELLDERRGKLQAEVDYKLFSDGIHLSTGKHGRTIEIHFKKLFEAHFRGVKPLAMKDYEKKLKAIGAVAKNSHYSANIGSRYGLFLPFEVFTELKYLADRLEEIRVAGVDDEENPPSSFCPF